MAKSDTQKEIVEQVRIRVHDLQKFIRDEFMKMKDKAADSEKLVLTLEVRVDAMEQEIGNFKTRHAQTDLTLERVAVNLEKLTLAALKITTAFRTLKMLALSIGGLVGFIYTLKQLVGW